MVIVLSVLLGASCPELGEQVLLGAFDKVVQQTDKASAPCERYLRALALAESDGGEPRPVLVALKDSPGPLGDWVNLRLAEIEWRAKAAAGSTRAPSPEFNQGYLTKLYQAALVLPADKLYDATVLEAPGPRRRAQLEVLAEAGASPDKVQRELFVEYPDSPQAPLAYPKATLADLVRRAAVANDKHMNDDVLKTVAAAQKMQPAPDDACALAFFAGSANRKLRKYAAAEAALSEAVAKCPDSVDYKKRAFFLLGQVQVIARSYAVAEPTMKKFMQQYKHDSLVDDAIFNVAASADRAGDAAKAIALYETVAKLDPPGDMCAEAAFRVAYGYYRSGEHQKALDRFVKIGTGALCGSDDYEKARGWYWESRTRAALKDPRAEAPLRTIIERQPLSYYALLARERLGQGAPSTQPAAQAAPLPTLPDKPITRRIKSLAALGLFKEAQIELASELQSATLEQQAAYAPLLAEARDYHRAHILFRSTLRGLLGPAPSDASLPAWNLAYPRPFAAQIAESERSEGLEPEFLLSLIREESAFQLDAGSWANAYGLTQMILDTALSTARDMKLGFVPTADQLRQEPGLSIKLGGHHLAMLKRMQPRPPLILAGYNSGMGNVKKWLTARGNKPMDEFIEEIPLDETRGYVKRIMRTWATYRTLAGKAPPRINLAPPGPTPQPGPAPSGG